MYANYCIYIRVYMIKYCKKKNTLIYLSRYELFPICIILIFIYSDPDVDVFNFIFIRE